MLTGKYLILKHFKQLHVEKLVVLLKIGRENEWQIFNNYSPLDLTRASTFFLRHQYSNDNDHTVASWTEQIAAEKQQNI